MLDYFIREVELRALRVRRRAVGNDLVLRLVVKTEVLLLDEQPAVHALEVVCAFRLVADMRKSEHAKIFLFAEHFERALGIVGRDDYFEEYLSHFLRGLFVDGAIARDDAAEDADGIALVSADVRRVYIGGGGDAAGIRVLARDDRRLIELAQEVERAVGVVDVVIRKLFAVELLRARERRRGRYRLAVERRALVRILAVAHLLRLVIGERDVLGEIDAEKLLHIARYQRVVSRGMTVDLVAERQTELLVVRAVLYPVEHVVVVGRLAHDEHVFIVFCGAPEHSRSAYIDVLDSLLGSDVRLLYSRLERVKVDRDEVYRVVAHFAELSHVLGQVAPREQSRMHRGVQGLDPAVQTFAEARDVGYGYSFDTAV